jgi:ubiquinone/menaquinone biosynthesis C-methylase UbiE
MKPCGERKPYTIPLPTRFIKFIKDKSLRNILDVGCGYGRTCLFMHENNFQVVGVDVDRVQVELALREIGKQRIRQGIELVVNDARNLCFPDSIFDAVTMLGVLTLVWKTERPKIINEVDRVLKPSGYIFIEEFGRTWENRVYRKRYKDDVNVTKELGTITVKDEKGEVLHFGHHFTRKELEALLKGFRLVTFEKGTFTSYYHRNWVKGYTILGQKQTG